jgi:predicted nucleic acid-binding protein
MPVVDASVLVEYLAGGEHSAQARGHLVAGTEALWAPHLIDAEVGHVVRRAVIAGELRPARARAALDDLLDVPIRRVSHLRLIVRAWGLRANLSFYDALYVALAERLSMPLLTLDRRLAGVPGVRSEIQVL